MNRKQLLERAIELKECSEEFESVEFLDSDVEFFANVVEIIQRTAQEVPVQEQSKTIEVLNKELNINLSQKQYDAIAILDICTTQYTAYEILKLLKILAII